MDLKCTKCVDTMIGKGEDASQAPPAAVLVPFTQALQTPQGTMLLGSVIGVCLECRKQDIAAPGSNGKLIRA
jgi:hypothetical protein